MILSVMLVEQRFRFADGPLSRLNMEVLSERYKRTSVEADLERVGPVETSPSISGRNVVEFKGTRQTSTSVSCSQVEFLSPVHAPVQSNAFPSWRYDRPIDKAQATTYRIPLRARKGRHVI